MNLVSNNVISIQNRNSCGAIFSIYKSIILKLNKKNGRDFPSEESVPTNISNIQRKGDLLI